MNSPTFTSSDGRVSNLLRLSDHIYFAERLAVQAPEDVLREVPSLLHDQSHFYFIGRPSNPLNAEQTFNAPPTPRRSPGTAQKFLSHNKNQWIADGPSADVYDFPILHATRAYLPQKPMHNGKAAKRNGINVVRSSSRSRRHRRSYCACKNISRAFALRAPLMFLRQNYFGQGQGL